MTAIAALEPLRHPVQLNAEARSLKAEAIFRFPA
jgi:hypothetical protein